VYACVDKILDLNDCHEVVSSNWIVNQIPMHHACGVGVMESRIVFIPEKGRGVKGETSDYWQKSPTGLGVGAIQMVGDGILMWSFMEFFNSRFGGVFHVPGIQGNK
jgi:hypothetical protein